MNRLRIGLALTLLSLLTVRAAFPLSGNPIRVFTLDNGLQVVMKEQHEKNLVAVNAYVMGGSRTESPDISGLSHYYEHLIFRGGTDRQLELETRKEFMGLGTFYGFTSDDVTCYYIVSTRENLDEALWRHADAVMNLDLTQENIDQERQVVVEEYNMYWDRPDYRVYYMLMETAYQIHPYRISPIGSKEVIQTSDIEKFRTFYDERYVPNQIVLACVGDFDTEALLEKVETLWGGYPRGKDSFELGLTEPEQTGFREVSAEMKAANSYMLWGFHVPGAAHDDIPALDLLDAILTGGENSRLFRALKVDENLALTITSYVDKRKDPSLLVIDLDLVPENEKRAVETVWRELWRIARNGVTPEELEAAKNRIENDYHFEHQSFISQAQTLAFYAANADIVLENYYLDQVAGTTVEEVNRVAVKYLRPANCSIATVRPEGSGEVRFAEIVEKISFPPVEEAVAASYPATRKVLDNGLTFISRPDFSSGTVAVEVYVKGGLLAEDETNNGICNFVSRSLLKGTRGMDASEIAGRIDELGIDLEASSGEDYSSISLLSSSANLVAAVDLLLEVLKQPSFPDEEISAVRDDILAEIRSVPDRSYDLTNREFARTIFSESPYRMPVLGDESTVSSLARGDLRKTHERLYVPSNMIVAVVGAYSDGDLEEIESRFASIHRGKRPAIRAVEGVYLPGLNVHHVDMEKAQITFNMGTMGVGVAHPDYLALKLVERALSRRLFFKYVYEEGIAYRMWAYLRPRLLATPFTFEMGVSASNYLKGRDGILGEVRRVIESGISPEDFENAKKNLITGFYLGQETNAGQARNMAFYEMAGLGYDFPDRIGELIDPVTIEQVDRAARKYLDPEKYTMVVVGEVPE